MDATGEAADVAAALAAKLNKSPRELDASRVQKALRAQSVLIDV